MAVAAERARDAAGAGGLQALQPEEVPPVPGGHPHLLPPAHPARHGLPRTGPWHHHPASHLHLSTLFRIATNFLPKELQTMFKCGRWILSTYSAFSITIVIPFQGYPYSMLCYLFFFLTLQVHLFQLYFANSLMQAWIPSQAKKSQ